MDSAVPTPWCLAEVVSGSSQLCLRQRRGSMRIDCIVCFNFCHYGTVVARSAAVAGVSYMRRGREAPRRRSQCPSGVVAGSDASLRDACMHLCIAFSIWNQFGDHGIALQDKVRAKSQISQLLSCRFGVRVYGTLGYRKHGVTGFLEIGGCSPPL
ncbi:hypothetical protein PVAP13_2NG336177 [Panicum virgatum]|uniref:Uncharacterized protein n=1 Tax=Panicum virgatum TaxID=38727 RepID=A0A8T0VKI6_PANVG|nr:hypothetical protein PVAP13_2NG336177 [Panicum virgatum]